MRFQITSFLFFINLCPSLSLINFVLIGSTGDLAKKYLWEALFVQYIENYYYEDIRIYGAATRHMTEGYPIIQSYINSLHCKESWSQELCHLGYQKFKERISYFQLRSSRDYELLHANISSPMESLRIFYLSVSPSLYEDIAFNINHHARPNSEIRVVFEKPFGMDFTSAVELSSKLSAHLQESEIYRVDHYLGKVGMRAIIDFRRANMDLLSELNFPYLRSSERLTQPLDNFESCEVTSSPSSPVASAPLVEVVMKEKEHTGGRSVYYDQFGIIRDVMQNHLTQALVYSLMHLHRPSTSSSSVDENSDTTTETFGQLEHRLHLLQQLKYFPSSLQRDNDNVCLSDASPQSQRQEQQEGSVDGMWLGQYEDYINHLEEDLIEYARKSSTTPPTEVSSNTPTAASIIFELLETNSSEPLPLTVQPLRVMISAGKALEAREMYVRVRSQSESESGDCSVVYGVQGGLGKYLGSLADADTGPFILLEGSCWVTATGKTQMINIPLGWTVLSSACHPDFLPYLQPHPQPQQQQGMEQEPSHSQTRRCIFRPSYIFEAATTPAPQPQELQTLPLQIQSNKFRGNAYVEILGALLRNDRSYFTTTEELLSQWKIWDRVLKDAECAVVNPYQIGWGGLDTGNLIIASED